MNESSHRPAGTQPAGRRRPFSNASARGTRGFAWDRSLHHRRRLAAVVVVTCLAPAVRAGVPIPKVLNNNHDFGEVWINDRVSVAFKIHNAGDGELETIDAVVHCPCVEIGRLDRRIEPGKTGEVLIQLDTASGVYGKFKQKVTLLTNVPGEPELDLVFTGVVREYVERSPVGVGLRGLKPTDSACRTVHLTNRTESPVTLALETPAQVGCFTFRLEEKSPGQAWDLRVDANPPYQPYRNEAVAKLKTNVKYQPYVTVVCTADVPPRLELWPYPLPANPAFAYREVRFINHGPAAVSVRKVTTDDPRLRADVVAVTEGREYLVRVVMPIGYLPPDGGHTITIETDDPEEPVLKLPFVNRQADAEPQEPAPQAGP